jgi:hypothetical protein
MPPIGPSRDVRRGNEGEDWKCRNVVGLVIDGVGGTIPSLPILGLTGVWMVRLRPSPSFLLGGV